MQPHTDAKMQRLLDLEAQIRDQRTASYSPPSTKPPWRPRSERTKPFCWRSAGARSTTTGGIHEHTRVPAIEPGARRQIIEAIDDPLTQRVLRAAFLGPGKRSWVQVALMIGGDNTPNTVCQIAHRGLNLVTFDPENNDTMKT